MVLNKTVKCKTDGGEWQALVDAVMNINHLNDCRDHQLLKEDTVQSSYLLTYLLSYDTNTRKCS
jgi:hypothetical protein